jgi:hypothetical protein
MAGAEGLDAHKLAITVRQELNDDWYK